VAQLVAALITVHGLLSFLPDVYGLFDLCSSGWPRKSYNWQTKTDTGIVSPRVDGVVKFEKQDEMYLCFEDEQYRPGS